jgi:hypothetical protein
MCHTTRHALGGLGLALPFIIANTVLNLDPGWSAVVRPHSGWLVWPLLALMFGGAVVAAWPVWQLRHWHWTNAIIAGVLAAISLALFGVIAEELVRCDVMLLPNCD